MSLADYQRKRRFDRTPEPQENAIGGGRPVFVVQLHHASHRHYDFRLQMAGVLKSWAVPKGPSLDPSVKRLAVEVEDHPVSYARFEGDIPKGEYGGGHVRIFDSGIWSTSEDAEKQLAKGHLTFELFGDILQGGWHLIRSHRRTSQRQWLLIKQDDAFASNREADDFVDEAAQRGTHGAMNTRQTYAGKRPATGKVTKGITSKGVTSKGVTSKVTASKGATSKGATSKGATSKGAASKGAASKGAASKASASKAVTTTTDANRRRNPATTTWRAQLDAFKGATRQTLLHKPFAPQLCEPADKAPVGDDWLHEVKWDGYRLLCTIVDGVPALWSRNGLDWTARLPDVARDMALLGLQQAAFDGELVVLNGVRSDFSALQATLSGEQQAPLSYLLFDLIHLEGLDLCDVPLQDRKALLQTLLQDAPSRLRYSSHLVGSGPDVFKQVTAEKLEGIISKRINAPYRAGRSRSWQKIKMELSDEFAIAGFIEPKGSRTGIGSLLLAVPQGRTGWRLAGRVGTGMNDAMLRQLSAMLRPQAVTAPTVTVADIDSDLRRAKWVRPRQVVEVFYRGYSSQGLLRHTAFRALREDKSVADLRGSPAQEEPMKKEIVHISSPDRLVYPELGVSKQDVADYYERVMDWLLPGLIGRPLAVLRCPDGTQNACFFQKHHTAGMDVSTVNLQEEQGGRQNYLMVRDKTDVMQLVQFNALEFHPWGAQADSPDHCDRLVFDLDPSAEVPWNKVKQAARQVRDLLAQLQLQSFVRTTGGKGLHVVAPLNPPAPWDDARQFARAFAESLAGAHPDTYIATASKKRRKGLIFVDYLRNGRGATSVCSYSLRARPGAAVATPLRWEELGRVKSSDAFTIRNVLQRLARLADDPWQALTRIRQSLPDLAE
ncbi:DNA ligase D [Advenella mimigardefordensis]|uniref:DNA ligase (ATP) n=1 Tax=Advenella mimigardefordensis (strain DSM 17166 / LMG 22922 / DPN7) TaxID=1247726 RepID=W0PE80_ADVMD|nr:DNA ligase D [Advenella mimigardefordensis]AHG65096.1 putative DNA ligase D [Advenella mimigardefordensis DPN7]